MDLSPIISPSDFPKNLPGIQVKIELNAKEGPPEVKVEVNQDEGSGSGSGSGSGAGCSSSSSFPLNNQRSGPNLKKLKGILLAFGSSLAFSFSVVIAKYFQKQSHSPVAIALWRYQGAIWPSILVFGFAQFCGSGRNKSLLEPVTPLTSPEKRKMALLLLTRSFLACTAVLLKFGALQYLDIGDIIVIGSCSPVLVGILAHQFLREQCEIVPIFLTFITLAGVFVNIRPPILTGAEKFDDKFLYGTGLALGSVCVASVSFVILRHLRKVHFALVNLSFGICGTLEILIIGICFGALNNFPEGTLDQLIVLVMAALMFVGQLCIVLALKAEKAAPISLIRTSDVILGFTWQYVFFGDVVDKFSIIGAVIILFGLGVTTFRKWLSTRPLTHPTRKAVGFLLR